jgi:hypothetical protein
MNSRLQEQSLPTQTKYTVLVTAVSTAKHKVLSVNQVTMSALQHFGKLSATQYQ